MKKILMNFVFASLVFFHLTGHAAETFTLDPNHSYVLWRVSHFDFSSPSGKWLANGTVTLDKDHPENSKVEVKINVGDLVTGIPEFDKHLKGTLFLNTAQFPAATFVSDKVTVTGENTADVQGVLTLRGKSKPVTLKVKMNKAGISPVSDKMTVGFSATTVLKRSDFGMTTLLPGVGDDVNIEIEAEAVKGENKAN